MARTPLLLIGAAPRAGSSSNTRKVVNRGRLLQALESARLITRIVVDAQARLLVEDQDWEQFWLPVKQISRADQVLDPLESVWSAYVRGGFSRELLRDYCFCYFRLLDRAVEWRLAEPENELTATALRRVLGFECFDISNATGGSALAAATSTVRNPAYLLTKLRSPDTLDSAEHLPLITTSASVPGQLFYHYRQHRLSHGSSSTILSYLDVDHGNRSESFRAVALLEEAIAAGTDPFAVERATRMARAGVLDYVRAWAGTLDSGHAATIDLVDLGAGSGLVAAKLCSEIAKCLSALGRAPSFRIWFVDLSMSRPARFFAAEGVAECVDSIEVVATDYREWLDSDGVPPKSDGIRLVLMSRFLNNLSDFAICDLEASEPSEIPGPPIGHSPSKYRPTYCLATEGPGPERLVVSNVRAWLETGRTFKQASLSPYFLGLRLATAIGSEVPDPQILDRALNLPVRTFRPDCLLTRNGGSVLGALARRADLVVVQDADMRASDLREHCSSSQLGDLVVLDATHHAGLRGHSSFLVVRRADPLVDNLPGEQIW